MRNPRPTAWATASIIALGALTFGRAARAEPSLDQAFAIDFEGQGAGATLLTAHAPGNQQAQMARTFAQVLEAYRQLANKAGIAPDDPDAAVAMFIAGTLGGLRKTDVSDPALAALIRQLHAHPEIARGLKADRPPVAEQLAIVGMFMFITQKSALDGAGARAVALAAHHYFTRYLGTEIDPLQLTDAGLTWSSPPTGLLAALAPTSAPAKAEPRAVTGKIETVAFRQTYHYGYNGFLSYAWDPVVLFQGGEGSFSLASLSDPAADKQQHPDRWVKWRKAGGKYQIDRGKGWEDTSFADAPLPAHTRLDASFSHESYGGSAPQSGGMAVAAWAHIAFAPSGRFSLGGGAGGFSASVATHSERATQTGTYDLSGYQLTLKFDDGSTQTRSLIMNGDRKMMYLDGVDYLKR